MQSIKRKDFNLYNTTELIQCKDGNILVRYFKGVGKLDRHWVTVQKNYCADIIPFKEFFEAEEAVQKKYPLFQYECVSYNLRTKEIRFEACPYFDRDEEPVINSCVLYNSKQKRIKIYDYGETIKHKWMLVKDDYTGFNVQASYNRSKTQEAS